MRFVVILAVFIVLAAPAYAEGAIPPPIPPAGELLPPPPPPDWGDQMRIESVIIGAAMQVDASGVDFADSRVGTFSSPTIERDLIEIEFKYTPMHIQSTAVPEPGGFLALGVGAVGLLGHRQRRRLQGRAGVNRQS